MGQPILQLPEDLLRIKEAAFVIQPDLARVEESGLMVEKARGRSGQPNSRLRLACIPHQSECGVRKTLMTNYPFVLFNKSPLQLRLPGAHGGRTFGRNQRARRARIAVMLMQAQTAPLCPAPGETAA